MQCEKIQDLLLTDHLDGRLARAEQEKIAAHLRDCAICREFAEIAKNTVLAPFAEAEQLTPPESIWQAVRQRIATEPRQTVNPLRLFLGKLRALLTLHPPALVATAVVAVALLTTLILRQSLPDSRPNTVNLENQFDYVTAMVAADDEDEEFDTAIEHYFL